jgi:hypothetical protein
MVFTLAGDSTMIRSFGMLRLSYQAVEKRAIALLHSRLLQQAEDGIRPALLVAGPWHIQNPFPTD